MVGRSAPGRSAARPRCWRMLASDSRIPATRQPGAYSVIHTSSRAGSATLHFGLPAAIARVSSRRRSVRRNDVSVRTRAMTRKVMAAVSGPASSAQIDSARCTRSGAQTRLAIRSGRSPSARRARPTSAKRSSTVDTDRSCWRRPRSASSRSTPDRPSEPCPVTRIPPSDPSSRPAIPVSPGSTVANIRVTPGRVSRSADRDGPAVPRGPADRDDPADPDGPADPDDLADRDEPPDRDDPADRDWRAGTHPG